ncbi:MAG: hypothetical protein IT340_09285 [Chloroflexi bacterium]|nr:hypothetical protein [Chloroflexota bacterium]
MTVAASSSSLLQRCGAILLCLVAVLATAPSGVAAAEWREKTTRSAVILHQPEHANTAEQLAALVDPVAEQMAALHDVALRSPITVRIYPTVEAYAQSSVLARTSYGQIAQVGPTGELAIAEPRIRNLSPEQMRNLLRRGVSHALVEQSTQGRLPVGLLEGVAQYSERPTSEIEVSARALDRARRERGLLPWADLGKIDRFAAQSETAAAQSYAIVAFLLDRYGLAPWQRFMAATRTAPDVDAALALGYGKPVATLESEWESYLPEFFGGSFRINYFARYDLATAREYLLAGRYQEARDELEALARFVAGAGRATKEAELREVARQVAQGMEAEVLLGQGQAQLASYQYATARETFLEAQQRFQAIGVGSKIEEVNQALASADAGIAAVNQLDASRRLISELKYPEARGAAMSAIRAFAGLGDEEHYRQSYLIIQELDGNVTRIAYLLGVLALASIAWAGWRLVSQSRRPALPGVLQ